MKKKIVVKRKSTSKHVADAANQNNTLLKTEYLVSLGLPAGIPAILLQRPKYQKKISDLKKDFEVVEVSSRVSVSSELRGYFNNDEFIANLAIWWEKYHRGYFTIERFTTSISEAQAALMDDIKNQPEKILAIKKILAKFAPRLLSQSRKKQWWEAQIGMRKKLIKKLVIEK